jgi:hypothetical protein
MKMVRPTVENLSEIISKLKELQAIVANIEDRPLEFPESQENNNKSLSIDQLMNAVGRKSAGVDALLQFINFSSYPQNINQATAQVLARLPSLSQSRLKKLLKDDIPQLLADDRISEVKKQVWHGESPLTEEAQNLYYIRREIQKQIQKNIEAAKTARWEKHVRPLINKIELLLFPFWDYLKEHGSYRRYQNVILMDLIRRADPTSLPEVINEFERVKYKLKVESQQSTPKNSAETGRKTKPVKETEAEKLERRFQPWTKSDDACFVIEGQRVQFHYKGKIEDLRLKNDSRTHELMFLFAAKNPLHQTDIKSICTKGTRPSDIVKFANEKLNERIAAVGFTDVPKNVEFVRYSQEQGRCYGLWPIIQPKDDFDNR